VTTLRGPAPSEDAPDDVVAARAHVREALGRGEYLEAFDRSERVSAEHPDDIRLRYLGVLALARAGAAQRAAQLLQPLCETVGASAGLAPDLAEDVAALEARLTKDEALASGSQRLARLAAERYEAIYRRLGRPYSCVNAATMWLIAGDTERARELARVARALVAELSPDAPSAEQYWLAATDAEAALVLDDDEAGRAALTRAATLVGSDLSSAATTRRQLALVLEHRGRGREVLELLPAPRVVHYCGHLISPHGAGGRFPAEAEPEVAAAIAQAVRGVRFGFGSLACGADILFAEALLTEGAELHVHLPCDVDDFVAASVAPCGAGWTARFDACLAGAAVVSIATPGRYDADDETFDYGARVAMGNALIRADFLAAPVEQLAVWDGQPPEASAGTARDVATWARTGRRTTVIPVPPASTAPPAARATVARPRPASARSVRALLFADVGGFSRLDDQQISTFLEVVMRPIAAAIAEVGPSVRFRNTWGDGIYLVLDDAVAAAVCGLAMQVAFDRIDFTGTGLPEDLTLRVAAHAGPVLERPDPVLGATGVYGTVVTLAARMEPGTPAGAVYVTDQLAALLALEPDAPARGQYVGRLPTAKDYGTFPMYVLAPTADRGARHLAP